MSMTDKNTAPPTQKGGKKNAPFITEESSALLYPITRWLLNLPEFQILIHENSSPRDLYTTYYKCDPFSCIHN